MGSTTILTLHEADATASHFRDTDSFRPHPDAADAAGQQGSAARQCLACQMALCMPTRGIAPAAPAWPQRPAPQARPGPSGGCSITAHEEHRAKGVWNSSIRCCLSRYGTVGLLWDKAGTLQ